jgi:peroxiredoxin
MPLTRILHVLAAWTALLTIVTPFSAVLAAADRKPLLDWPREPVPALDFSAKTLGGKTIRLSDFHGQVVFLNFWATWCVPCKAEMPAMERIHQALRGRPFKMLAVNLQESPEAVRRFAEELKLTFDLVLDPTGEIARGYGANTLPLTYLIDKKGRILARAIGERRWDGKAYRKYIEVLVAGE